MGVLALIANLICLRLIAKHKNGDVNFRASHIFSANDVVANMGVNLSSAIVVATGSQWPNILIVVIIAINVIRGGISILREAKLST